MKATTKKIIIFSAAIAALGYAAVFIYQRNLRKKADKNVVSLDEAINMLNKK